MKLHPMHLRSGEAARHSLEAHMLLEGARNLRRAARRTWFLSDDEHALLLRMAGKLDKRRQRLMKLDPHGEAFQRAKLKLYGLER